MGTYNSAVITTAGQSLLARAIADNLPFYFSSAKTTEYVVPTGTSAASLTELPNIKQSEEITSATVSGGNQVATSVRFDNTEITLNYSINTIGVYARVGTDTEETLLAVITAITADVMPSYSAANPVSYVYSINLAIANASNINIIVAPTGAPNYAEFNELSAEVEALDAEVQNARIGADGVTYPTLGDAIRTNDSALKSQIDVNLINVEAIMTDGGLGTYDPITLTIEFGAQYLINNGVASKNTSSQYWCNAVVAVTAGQSYLVTVRSQITGKYGCIFTDDSFNVISKDIEGLDDSGTGTIRTDQVEYVPVGATKMILNSCENSGNFISAKKYAFTGIPIAVIASNTMGYVRQDYTTLNGYYSKTSNAFTSNVSYFSVYEPCVPGDRFKVSSTIKDSPISIIQYYKSDGSLLSYVDNGGGLPKTVTNYDATAPNQAAYFSVTSYQVRPVIFKYTLNVEPKHFPLFLHRRNALAEVMFKYTADKDAIVTFNKVGPNSILQIAGFQTIANTDDGCSGDFDAARTTLRNAGSDWMSPYKVIAVNNADGDGSGQGVNGYYTGGFHGYNGDQTGSATGSTTSFKFFVDGKEVTETADAIYHASDEIVILVTNAIQGNNTTKSNGTGRAILQEQIKYTITPKRIDIENTISALEDIVISQYYGLQLFKFSNMTGFLYYGDTVEEHDFSAVTSYTQDIDYLVGGLDADPDRIVCQLDKKGIGRHQYIKRGGIMARSIIGGKAYNNLVDNSPNYLPLSTNDSVFISGHYAFAEGYIPD